MTTFTKEQLISHARESVSYLENVKGRVSKEGADCKVVLEMVERDLELARIALTSLEAEPVAVNDDMAYAFHHVLSDSSLGADEVEEIKAGLRAAFANVTIQPEPVVPDEIGPNDSNTFDYVDGWNACRAAMLHGAEPVSQTYKLPPLSSSEANDAAWKLHNMLTEHVPLNGRQFNNLKGCFYEALKVAMRNYPVTPDGWISCSERMPVIGEINWRTSFPLLVTCEIGVIPAYYGFVRVNGNKHYGFMESLKYGDDSGNHPQTNEYDLISNVTHWMPLPEPPQEVK
ncbi:DUF551 domain-containing protein [Escherichia coli]|uniref:DUF551 domain-containing protein n=2 Tax=Escherichia coli TaxID=562 RepID=UPI00259DC45C|nr:DUF551 domain-containing protein [Escherichia coli]EKV7677813.1 DUF551 domain-containing protein [Escherichia coli]MDT9460508.1 DUF551 domain-containing protein [Escherichia coli]HCO5831994.1 DUF551 domain-containing protein [Escherichia coli]HCO6440576.1 DUF551 domain-containing protein [Escherichia coli]